MSRPIRAAALALPLLVITFCAPAESLAATNRSNLGRQLVNRF
jgi:hypothetical protein